MPERHYLIIAGPIGVGKSTLTSGISQQAGFCPLFEAPDQNPYIEDFYASQRQQKAFETQLAFLGLRLQQCRRAASLLHTGQKVVQDRSIYEDSHIFTTHHYQQGLMSRRDFQTYLALYQGMVDFLPQPDLIIYLSAPVDVLQARIAERGRDYEQDLAAAYLQELNTLYRAWAESCHQQALPFVEIDTAHSRGPEAILEQVLTLLAQSQQGRLPVQGMR